MAIRRLSTMWKAIADGNTQAARGRAALEVIMNRRDLVEVASVIGVQQSTAIVQTADGADNADLATDEALQNGQEVYIAHVDTGGIVVLGAVKHPPTGPVNPADNRKAVEELNPGL